MSEATFTPSIYTPAAAGCQSLASAKPVNVLNYGSVENTPELVQIGVTLQVTYAIVAG